MMTINQLFEDSMSEQVFLQRCEALLNRIEDLLGDSAIDHDTDRQGHVLTVTFEDNSQMVINGQAVMQEIWLAYRGGAHHFRLSGAQWLDTRSGESLSTVLSKAVSAQAGQGVVFAV
jgi:CyaY protein